MDQIKIGNYIATKRKAKALTQSELANILGISTNAVSKWERGLNMPDVAKIEELCAILDISLNELFKAEDIAKTAISDVADDNLLTMLKTIKVKDFKLKMFKTILMVIIVLIALFGLNEFMIAKGYKIDHDLAYVQVYYPLHDEIKGDVELETFISRSVDYDIAANRLGKAVFKNPQKAFKSFKKDYAQELKIVKQEFALGTLNNFNLAEYCNLAWQSTMVEEYPDIKFITKFLDIYQNSFR